MKDTDFLFLTAMLRARESRMLSREKIERMLDIKSFDDAAKILTDCGYPDMSGMGVSQIEDILTEHRREIFYELSNNDSARNIADLFRMKYDYHNIKVLVKAMAANDDGSDAMSEIGRVGKETVTEAFISGERQSLPAAVRTAMGEAVGVMSRTKNPQLTDIIIDKAYYSELLSHAIEINDRFITGYVRLLIDSANLRTFVRSQRVGRDADFLKSALIPGGTTDSAMITEMFLSGAALSEIFTGGIFETAVQLGVQAAEGGTQTQFELACDNAVMSYIQAAVLLGFGAAHVAAYLAALEWEVTSIRMILSGKLHGVAPEVIRERLRDCYV